VSKEA